jgi:hypothetical protein
VRVFLLVVALVFASCGGSSSESSIQPDANSTGNGVVPVSDEYVSKVFHLWLGLSGDLGSLIEQGASSSGRSADWEIAAKRVRTRISRTASGEGLPRTPQGNELHRSDLNGALQLLRDSANSLLEANATDARAKYSLAQVRFRHAWEVTSIAVPPEYSLQLDSLAEVPVTSAIVYPTPTSNPPIRLDLPTGGRRNPNLQPPFQVGLYCDYEGYCSQTNWFGHAFVCEELWTGSRYADCVEVDMTGRMEGTVFRLYCESVGQGAWFSRDYICG